MVRSNLSNTFLFDGLLTTKYPLGVVLMEVAHQCRKRRVSLRASWVPRLENQEADDLTNLEFKSFDPKFRMEVNLESRPCGVLRELFGVGGRYFTELGDLKTLAAKVPPESEGSKKRSSGAK